jgi:hypothetical protein
MVGEGGIVDSLKSMSETLHGSGQDNRPFLKAYPPLNSKSNKHRSPDRPMQRLTRNETADLRYYDAYFKMNSFRAA